MLVIVCGMPRSGSTLHYQIACGVLEAAGLGAGRGWDWEAVDPAVAISGWPAEVVKVHQPRGSVEHRLDEAGVAWLYSHRDPRDAAVSYMQKWGAQSAAELEGIVHGWRRASEHFLAKPRVLVSAYDRFARDIASEVDRVARFLGVELTPDTVDDIARCLTPEVQRRRLEQREWREGEEWDPQTLLHRGHIQGGETGKWREALLADQVAAIERAAGEWLTMLGYAPGGVAV